MLRQLRLVMANTITSFICSLQTIVSKREKDLLIDKEPNSVAQKPNRRPPNSTPQTLYLEILIPKPQSPKEPLWSLAVRKAQKAGSEPLFGDCGLGILGVWVFGV